MKKTHNGNIVHLEKGQVFVFGSNLKGIHGAGAAKQALKWGAFNGCHSGTQGKTYAIPTKRSPSEKMPLDEIKGYVYCFLVYAKHSPKKEFLVTDIGTGLAGHSYEDIAALFADVPGNVILSEKMQKYVDAKK